MHERPRFIQGVFAFRGVGLGQSVPLRPAATFKVPFDKRAQLVYLRAGNSTAEMIYLCLLCDKKPFRFFPVSAKGAIHVPLAIVEDIHPETEIELAVGAPEGLDGLVMVDLGLLEI